MQYLEVRRRSIYSHHVVPRRNNRYRDCWYLDSKDGDRRNINVEVNRLLMVERNRVAFLTRGFFCGRFAFATAILPTAALRALEHEILLARDAATSQHGGKQ